MIKISLFVDTHSHLDILEERGIDLEIEVENAKNSEISFIVQSIDSFESNFTSTQLAEKFKNFVFSLIGVHPQQVQFAPKNYLEILQNLLDRNREKVVAIGEIGVDLHYPETKETKKLQLEFFETLISFSVKNSLPIEVHSWDSFDETFEILKKFKGRVRGGIHSFSYGFFEAKKFIDELDFFISFAGSLTYPKNQNLHETISKIPKEKIVFETDSPFMPPTGFRGKPNSPLLVKEVYKFAKERFGIDERQVFENVKKFLKIT